MKPARAARTRFARAFLRWTTAALAGPLAALIVASPGPAGGATARSAGAAALHLTECQHPVRTGVEVYRLHGIASRRACPVALALYRWEITEDHERALFGCRGIGHPFLKRHSFHGWHLRLTPEFVMSRRRASFAVGGTDFPINCS